MDLVLIRHGQTDSNIEFRYCGQTDAPLNKTGIEQVEDAAQRMYNWLGGRFDSIHSSSLIRAYDSARIIAERFGVEESEIIKTKEIAEAHFGIFEDMTYDEIMRNYPTEFKEWKNSREYYVIRNGESAQMVRDRAGAFFDGFISAHDQGVHLFVMHMGVIAHSIAYLLGLEIETAWRFHIDNAGAAAIRVSDNGYCCLTALNV